MVNDERTVQDFMPDSEPPSEFVVTGGTPLSEGTEIATHAEMVEVLRTVFDPEIPVNIYDLGLVYRCDIDQNGSVVVEMTLTAPGCPVAGEMPQWVADALTNVAGVGEVTVALVWDPPWDQEKMSEEAKLELGMF